MDDPRAPEDFIGPVPLEPLSTMVLRSTSQELAQSHLDFTYAVARLQQCRQVLEAIAEHAEKAGDMTGVPTIFLDQLASILSS